MFTVEAIRSLQDNYIWAIKYLSHVILVDPGSPIPALDYLRSNNLILDAIIVTHHHYDHVAGVDHILSAYPVTCYCPDDDRISSDYFRVNNNSELSFFDGNLVFKVIHLPGHTISHVAYYGSGFLFCGDVLFSLGCGMIFEGSYKDMSSSLDILHQLPKNTKVYCAHEYTIKNIEFALWLEPTNKIIYSYREYIISVLKSTGSSIPSTIEIEQQCNPFLAYKHPRVHKAIEEKLNINIANNDEAFRYLMYLKDIYRFI